MKDARGNELKEGDLVLFFAQANHMQARVVRVDSGGIITGLRKGGQEVKPAQLVLHIEYTVMCHPNEPVGQIFRLHDETVLDRKGELTPLN
jgi:hypothetical protein